MGDIATTWSPDLSTGDWALSLPSSLVWTDEHGNSVLDQLGKPVSSIFKAGTGLVADQELFTAVLISLFTDAQAGVDDVIPDGTDDPRGWWGGSIGSLLWLRLRSKATPLVAALVQHDIFEALAWLKTDGVAARVAVETKWAKPNALSVRVVIYRNNGTVRALAFSQVWENT